MYTMEIIEQVTLALTVTYYGTHLKQRLGDYWEKTKEIVAKPFQESENIRAALVCYFAFFLHGCVEIGPLSFYGLHLYSLVMGHQG